MGDDHVANAPTAILPPPRIGRYVLDSTRSPRVASDCDRDRGHREEGRGDKGEGGAGELEATYGPKGHRKTADRDPPRDRAKGRAQAANWSPGAGQRAFDCGSRSRTR